MKRWPNAASPARNLIEAGFLAWIAQHYAIYQKESGHCWCEGDTDPLRARRCQRSADASDVEIARVDDLVDAEGDESCCRHAEEPTAQPARLCSEGAE